MTVAAQVAHRRGLGLASRRRRIPRSPQPDAIRLAYYKAIREVLVAARTRAARALAGVVALRQDADGKTVGEILERLTREFLADLSPKQLESLARRFADRTKTFNREGFAKQVKAALGVDVFAHEPQVSAKIEAFVAENVALIRSVPREYLGDVEKAVAGAARGGTRAEDLAATLQERFGVAERRARIIARDQIGKLNGELTEARQREMGVDKYLWRTMRDGRVRDEHAEREGQAFAWDDPPEDGHPGEPILCRCYAEPDFSGILDSIEGS